MLRAMHPPVETIKALLPSPAELAKTRPLELPNLGRMALTSYAKDRLFPLAYELSEAVYRKGRPFHATPKDASSPLTHFGYTHVEDKRAEGQSWYLASLQTPVEEERLTDRTGTLGEVSWSLNLSDHTPGITLYGLRHGVVAATNHYPNTGPQIIDSAEALFGELPKNIYSPSNPALWVARLVQGSTLEAMQAELAGMPTLRS